MSAITPIVKCWRTFLGMFTWEIVYHADVSVVSYWGHIEVSLVICQLIVQWVIEYEDMWCFSQVEFVNQCFSYALLVLNVILKLLGLLIEYVLIKSENMLNMSDKPDMFNRVTV